VINGSPVLADEPKINSVELWEHYRTAVALGGGQRWAVRHADEVALDLMLATLAARV
jgi:hypothetical protein